MCREVVDLGVTGSGKEWEDGVGKMMVPEVFFGELKLTKVLDEATQSRRGGTVWNLQKPRLRRALR